MNSRPARRAGVVLAMALALSVGLKGSIVRVSSGTWAPAASMAEAREGAAAVLLEDGRILVTGGEGPAGVSAEAAIFGTDGAWAGAAPMNGARRGHIAVKLADGRVLVAGGETGSGATNAAEIYDPAGDSWSSIAGGMIEARAGHTASLLEDGRVLLAGGENGGAVRQSAEVFDPVAASFSAAGLLAAPRKDHAAAALPGGRVLIVGGSDGINVLDSTEVYDPASGFSAGPAMAAPRAGHSATALLDGKVIVAGGSNGSDDVATAELYDPAAGTFAAASSLAAPRRGHLAFRLPHNNSVLVVGGTSGENAAAGAELYLPWQGAFQATGAPAAARVRASGSAHGQEGILWVGGGSGSASSELYGFATVKTDKDDYAPGEIVTITGSGWQPGESVTLLLEEAVLPPFHEDRIFTAIADAQGNIFNNQFAPETHDIGVRFYLTASGQTSALNAQTTFTDGTPIVQSVVDSPFSPNQASSVGTRDTIVINARNQGSGAVADFRIRVRAGTATGTLVKEFLKGAVNGNTDVNDTWNGKDTAGNYVADGTYVALASNGTSDTTSAPNIKNIVVDNTNPAVALTSPADNVFVKGSVSLVAAPTDTGGDDSNIDKVQFYVDGVLKGTDTSSGGGGWNFALNTATLADGDRSWYAIAFDKAGNNTASSSRTIRVDNTDPSVAVNAVANGTVATPMTITGTASDLPALAGYGVASVQVTIKRTSDGAVLATGAATNTGTNFSTWSFSYTPSEASTQNANAKATDQAGNFKNSAAVNFTVIADTTPPVITPVVSGTLGSNGWYTSDVSISWNVSDAESTITSQTGCGASSVTTDTTGVSFTCSATSSGGTASQTVNIKRDASPPTAALAVSAGTAGANGWYTSDVTVSTSGVDSISSPVVCTADQFQAAETTGAVFNGSCTNNAGLSTNAAPLTVKLDKTGPSASLSVTAGTLGANGWYVSNVTLGTSGADSISSPVVCTADQFQTTDTSSATFNGSCTNDAGLSTNAAPVTIKRDATPPVIQIVAPTASGAYVLNASVMASYGCTDATSGLNTCGGPVASGATFSTSPVGPHSFTVNATDLAGNPAVLTHAYSVVYATGGMCYGSPGHQILQPVNGDGSSVFKQRSTVPAKFRVCDANGVSIGAPGVVSDFRLVWSGTGTPAADINEPVVSTTPDAYFRWSATDQQWIFNINTKGYQANKTYLFRISLDDGSQIEFLFGLK